MDFAAVPATLAASGSAAAEAVTALRGADCWTPVSQVSAALPGAEAAGAASAYVSAWTTYFTGWCSTAERHARSLTVSADAYLGTEQRNADGLTGTGAPDDGTDDGTDIGRRLNAITKVLG